MTSTKQSLTSKNGLLRICFARSDDRFHHTIEHRRAAGEEWRSWLESVEGTPSESWPPSPPYQQVEQHVAGSGFTCLLAVGLAGSSHWSATVEEIASEDQLVEETRLRFDVACRIKLGTAQLGSVYKALDAACCPEDSERGIEFEFDGYSIRLDTDSMGTMDGQNVAVKPRPVSETEALTVRWVYDFVSIPSE